MNDKDHQYDYPEIVKHTIRQHEKEDYLVAAKYINECQADICIVQHEFGIYGGESGAFVLSLLQQLKMPIVSTVHTVMKNLLTTKKISSEKWVSLARKWW